MLQILHQFRNDQKRWAIFLPPINTGFIIGPGIGGFIAEYVVRLPFFFAAAIAFSTCISSIFILKEPLTKEQLAEISANTKQTNFISDLKRSLNLFYFIAFIIVFVLASVYQHMKLFSAYFLIINSASRRRTLPPLLQ